VGYFSSSVLPLSATKPVLVPKEIQPKTDTQADADTPIAKNTPRVGLTAWVIQVGSFSNQANAEGLVKKLQKKKFPAFLEQTDVKGKTLYRVRVGPEIDQKLAQQLLKKLDRTLKPMKLKGTLKRYR